MTAVLAVVGAGTPGELSGAERMAWRTTAELARRGHPTGVLAEGRRPADMSRTSCLRFGSPEELPAAGWVPDVVHIYDLAAADYVAVGRELAARFGTALVATPASAPETWPDPRLGHRICTEARLLFAITAAEAAALRQFGATPDRIRGIPQAPDLLGSGNGRSLRARLRVTGPLVLFLGRRVRTKGYQLLLDAAPLIWAERPETVLAFAGPYGEPAATRAFRRGTDPRILDIGVLTDAAKHDALVACDLLCLPSSADVFPLVFAEAWSCGKPVVSGRFAGSADVVRHGIDGLVVDLTARDVAAAVLRLLGDGALRAALGAAGLARVREEMGWHRVAAAVERGYGELAARAPVDGAAR